MPADPMTLMKKPTFLMKIIALVMAVICTGLVIGEVSVSKDLNKIAVIYVTIIGFIIISLIAILGFVLGTPLSKHLHLFIAGIGFIMFLTAGALMCENYSLYNREPRLLASGILALFNSVFYIGDAFLTFTEKE